METIIVSVITGLCVAVPNLIATIMGNRKNNAIIEFKIDELTEKVKKHNSIMERTFRLEEKVSNIEKDITEIKAEVQKK